MTVSDWLGVAGLVVGLVGFYLTIKQLTRTADASEATVKTLAETAGRMNTNHLLVLLPQLQVIQNDLDESIEKEDRNLARRALVSYAQTATQVAALLAALEDAAHAELVERLKTTAHTASQAKSRIVTSPESAILAIVKTPAKDIAAVSTYAAGLVAQYQVKVN